MSQRLRRPMAVRGGLRALSRIRSQAPTDLEEPRPSRVEGAVAFTDIVGFTEFTASAGDEQALELLAAQELILRETLPRDARVVKEIGDGMMLWFPGAPSAVTTAMRLRARFADEEEGDVSGFPLGVRIGIHYGMQLCRGEDLVGHSVNVASRIVNIAGPHEVLISEAVVKKLDGLLVEIDIEEVGPVVMKGIPDPVRLFRVEPSPFPPPLD